MKGLGYLVKNFNIRLRARTKISPISSPFKLPEVSMNAATPALSRALRSRWRLLICTSLVRTTQSRFPTSASHSVSGASPRKWSEWISTLNPAFKSMLGTILSPNARSMKKTGGSGCGSSEFASKRFLDFLCRPSIIVHKLLR